jgi:hypothetical protein
MKRHLVGLDTDSPHFQSEKGFEPSIDLRRTYGVGTQCCFTEQGSKNLAYANSCHSACPSTPQMPEASLA